MSRDELMRLSCPISNCQHCNFQFSNGQLHLYGMAVMLMVDKHACYAGCLSGLWYDMVWDLRHTQYHSLFVIFCWQNTGHLVLVSGISMFCACSMTFLACITVLISEFKMHFCSDSCLCIIEMQILGENTDTHLLPYLYSHL